MRNRQNIPGNARRLKGAITRLEQQPYNFMPARRLPRAPSPQFAVGLTTSGVSARSGTTPGSGTVTIEQYDGSVLSDSTITVTAYTFSGSTNTIASGKYVSMMMWAGVWWIISAEC